MKTKSKSNNNLLSKDDRCYEEEVEENGICELPVTGTPVAQFTFSDNLIPKDEPMLKFPMPSPSLNLQSEPTSKNIIAPKDDRTTKPYPYGITPPVDGEYLDTRRSFSFRKSTIRMLNELKAADPDINVYLNSIMDKALRYYHEYIFKEKNLQN